jgi:stage II sporulation protein D
MADDHVRITAVTGRFLATAAAGVLFGALLVAAPAGAATSGSGLYLTGAGNGHGIGMSQYGAAGYALHGVGYQQILRNYYAQTTLGHVSPNRPVTVLLRAGGSAVFSGATTIKGWSAHKLDPAFNYSVERAGPKLRVLVGRHLIGTFTAPLQVSGPGPLTLVGLGVYRGSFVFRANPRGSGVMTVNSVGLDNYVRGVVSAEMPSNWPQQALDAQAVAARTYALTSHPIGADFDLWDNTKSQMYQGVKAETAASDAAVAATSGQVVEYDGSPVTTYFFASSGGETESVQNVFQIAPAAWLVGRPDPYDDSLNNPFYRWKMRFSLHSARAKLGKLVDGSLQGIKILQRGVSPRIVKAEVVGTKGSVTVTGAQLRKILGTPSTWVKFTTVSAHGVQTSTTPAATTTVPAITTPTDTGTTTTGTTPTGGGGLGTAAAVSPLGPIVSVVDQIADILGFGTFDAIHYEVNGTIFPADRGARVTVQMHRSTAWATVAAGVVGAGGRYSVSVVHPGNYRVLYGGTVGPEITVS